jgi:hypothetical protein
MLTLRLLTQIIDSAAYPVRVAIDRASCGDLHRSREPIAIKAPYPGASKAPDQHRLIGGPPLSPAWAERNDDKGAAGRHLSATNWQAGFGKSYAFPARW